jgi:hypothetical protein
MPRNKTMIRRLLDGTDLTLHESPSYMRIAGSISTVAYAHGRADGSLRLQVRRPDGMYPDVLSVDGDEDFPAVRRKLKLAEDRLVRAKTRA